MDDTLFDVINMNAYADSVWNDSLSSSTKLIDDSLRTTPGKYDEEDSSIYLVANKRRKEHYSKTYENLKKDLYTDEDYDYDSLKDSAYILDDAIDSKQNKILIQRKKKKESFKKFVARMAAAIVICSSLYAYHEYINRPAEKPVIITVDGVDFDASSCAHERLDRLEKKYNLLLGKRTISYIKRSREESYTSVNYDHINNILSDSEKKGELELRIATFLVAKHIPSDEANYVLNRCLKYLNYTFISKQIGMETIGKEYRDIYDYLENEEQNIYSAVLEDTINRINEGSIIIDSDGNFYEVDFGTEELSSTKDESSSQGRSK